MNPYYQDEAVTLYHGDARDVLPTIEADVCVTDPPYAVRWSKGACEGCGNDDLGDRWAYCLDCLEAHRGRAPYRRLEMLGFVSPNWHERATHSRGYADHDPKAFAVLMDEVWEGVARALPPGALLAHFGGNRTLHEQVASAVRSGFSALDILCFSSPGGVAKSTTTLRPGFELASLMRLPGPVRHINPDWKGTNHFQIPKPRKSESGHITTKPSAWMDALVDLVSDPGDTILDPFAGSGSTLLAAKRRGRKAIGIEWDEGFCEMAAGRFDQGLLDFGGVA